MTIVEHRWMDLNPKWKLKRTKEMSSMEERLKKAEINVAKRFKKI